MANNPAGEISLNLGITGPHYTLGAACAAGNAGIIQGAQMLRLGDCDVALAGGVSESIHTFGIFASFHSQGALARHADPTKASRPFDADRNGIVVAEGGCLFVLERLTDARPAGAKIYGEVAGYAMNSDASDFVLPNPERQAECIRLALRRAALDAGGIDIVSTHATGTASGDAQECRGPAAGVRHGGGRTLLNNTKSFIGHAMGAAGALELAGNLPAFEDGVCHATINLDRARSRSASCPGLVANQPREIGPGATHFEQFVRDAGDQFRGHRATKFNAESQRHRHGEQRPVMTAAEIRASDPRHPRRHRAGRRSRAA